MSDSASLRVSGNTPRLLKEGETPPARVDDQVAPEELAVPQLYWTPDKAQHVVAKVMHAASKFYGPSVKAAEWELDLIGEPAAAVMNDWLPLRTGASSDKTANLIALAVVTAIIVALRLPDILEVHGIIKPWRPKNQNEQETQQQQQQPAQAQPAAAAPAPPAPAGSVAGTFDQQLVGANGDTARAGGGGDDKMRDLVYGAQQVGGGGGFVVVQGGDQ